MANKQFGGNSKYGTLTWLICLLKRIFLKYEQYGHKIWQTAWWWQSQVQRNCIPSAHLHSARTCIQRAPLSYFAHFHRDKGPRAVVRDLPRKARSSPQLLKKVSFFLQYCNFIPPVLQTYRIFIRLSVNSIKYWWRTDEWKNLDAVATRTVRVYVYVCTCSECYVCRIFVQNDTFLTTPLSTERGSCDRLLFRWFPIYLAGQVFPPPALLCTGGRYGWIDTPSFYSISSKMSRGAKAPHFRIW